MSKPRAVNQYGLDGQFIKEFASIAEAERLTDVAQSNIVNACRCKINSAGGSIWKYSNKVKV